MISTRTPYRISFFGGGTDFPAYYQEHGGAVLSATINRYSYLHCRVLPPFFDHRYRIRCYQTERVHRLEDIQHPSARECIRHLDFPHPLEILHSGDLPSMSGIGSSSAFTVGLLLALYGLKGQICAKRQLSENAVFVEQQLIKENVGSQDQFAVAFGGLNRIDFGPGSHVQVSPLTLTANRLEYLQNNLLFCFTGQSRLSSEIQAGHPGIRAQKSPSLSEQRQLVEEGQKLLNGNEDDLDQFGRLLGEAWQIKRRLAPKVSRPDLDELYEYALKHGALGGKLCGAGGGGFFLFYVQPHQRAKLSAALADAVMTVPIKFENLGAHVIFYTPHS